MICQCPSFCLIYRGTTYRFPIILPDLFREGQGIVAEGILDLDGEFLANTVLAKHDENYMPPELSDLAIAADQKAAGTSLLDKSLSPDIFGD